ncbi:8376_t:CDS:2 [Funneliformis geosporum]|uniref:8376_t:CDS:1 n=1 Tax=Funneliformis geosporum TaxID=1117311 RepID=A0A9W4T0Q6_9GLOM|nr:8376_t:CDS:2 [Funneliformis geosporum]
MLDPNRTKIEEWCRLGFPVPSQARVIRSTRPGQLDSMKAKIKIIKSNNQPTTEPRNLWKKRDRAWLGQVNLVLGKARPTRNPKGCKEEDKQNKTVRAAWFEHANRGWRPLAKLIQHRRMKVWAHDCSKLIHRVSPNEYSRPTPVIEDARATGLRSSKIVEGDGRIELPPCACKAPALPLS